MVYLIYTKSLVGNIVLRFFSSSSVTFVIGNIPAGKSNKFHANHVHPAVGTSWKNRYSWKCFTAWVKLDFKAYMYMTFSLFTFFGAGTNEAGRINKSMSASFIVSRYFWINLFFSATPANILAPVSKLAISTNTNINVHSFLIQANKIQIIK